MTYLTEDKHNVGNKRSDITLAQTEFNDNPTMTLEQGVPQNIDFIMNECGLTIPRDRAEIVKRAIAETVTEMESALPVISSVISLTRTNALSPILPEVCNEIVIIVGSVSITINPIEIAAKIPTMIINIVSFSTDRGILIP